MLFSLAVQSSRGPWDLCLLFISFSRNLEATHSHHAYTTENPPSDNPLPTRRWHIRRNIRLSEHQDSTRSAEPFQLFVCQWSICQSARAWCASGHCRLWPLLRIGSPQARNKATHYQTRPSSFLQRLSRHAQPRGMTLLE